MRAMALGVVAAAALATTAFAQTDFEAQHHMLQGRASGFAAKGTPLASLTKASQDWIKAETKRQTDAPRSVGELAKAVDVALHEDEVAVARAHHLNTLDIVLAITLQITRDAEEGSKDALKAARKSGDAAAIKAASDKVALAAANRKAAMKLQNDASLELAGL